MVSSKDCPNKLDLVNWYIDILDAGDRHYIVPHSKAQLERIRDGLQEAHKQSMAVKIKKPGDRPIIDLSYLKEHDD